MGLDEMIKHLKDENFVEFKKEYVAASKENYAAKKEVVKRYVCKRIGEGKQTNF